MLTSRKDLLLWKLNLVFQVECSIFVICRFFQYYSTYETLGQVNFHLFWILGWTGPTVFALIIAYYRYELVANFNRALKWDMAMQGM